RREPPHPADRQHAQPGQPAQRLSLPHPLPARPRRAVLVDAAAVAGLAAGQPIPLPHPAGRAAGRAGGALRAAQRSAIVTGAASGIGRAVARRLAAEGFAVTIADVRRDPLTGGEPTDELIAHDGGTARFRRTDVGVPDECVALIEEVAAAHGSLDVLVNNAV